MRTDILCPCGTLKDYSTCCGPLHQGIATAESAEQLMRSRFSAFSRDNVDYLLASTHQDHKTNDDKSEIEQSIKRFKWLRLDIHDKKAGLPTDKYGTVEFTAYFVDTSTGQTGSVRERSNFIKSENNWFYTDGITKQHSKIGRNEQCWCGSGKKFKKCHGLR